MTKEEKKQQDELWKQDKIKERKEEWEKIKNLGFGARLGYFWDYYKFILIIIAIILFIIYMIMNVIRGLNTDMILYVCAINSDDLAPNTDQLKADYIEARGGKKSSEEMTIDTSVYLNPNGNGTSQQDVAASVKITSYVGSGSMDVFLAPADVADFEQTNGFYKPLDDLLTEEEISRLGQEGCLYYETEPETDENGILVLHQFSETDFGPQEGGSAETEPDDGTGENGKEQTADSETMPVEEAETEMVLNTEPGDGKKIFAVRVDQGGLLEKYDLYYDRPIWFSIIGNSSHTEEAIRFLHFLLGEDIASVEK